MKRLILYISALFLLPSCNIMKFMHLMKSGEVAEEKFYTTVPFEIKGGIIILKATINGKQYDFYLDTGAPNVISTGIAKELGVKPNCKISSSDSQGNEGKIEFGRLCSITIGNVEFQEQGAAIVDFSENRELECMGMTGIIGANLMKQAYWQINMQDKTIIITDDKGRLDIPDNAYEVPFKPTATGTPEISMYLKDNRIDDIVFDYGSNGGIMMSTNKVDDILKHHDNIQRSYGENSLGLYGGNFDTTFTFICDSIQIGPMVTTEVVDFSRKGESTLGTKFLEDYIVSFDWEDEKIYMERIVPKDSLTEYKTFGFSPYLVNDSLEVAYIYENSLAYKAGMRLGDKVLEINDKDCTRMASEEYCQMVIEGVFPDEMEEVDITYMHNGEVITARLVKRNIFD